MPKKTQKKPSAKKHIGKTDDLREKINVEALLLALEQHVMGEKEMTATQVNSGSDAFEKDNAGCESGDACREG